MDLTITSFEKSSYHLITLVGDVDTKTAPSLHDTLSALRLATLTELRIEMYQVGFLSSAGLRALLFAKQKMPHSSRLILIGSSDGIADVVTKTGLDKAITLAASHDAIG